ncbi:transport and Golgi organization protein 1 homolog isoform X8 [Carassius auratus]|uniref:Transport and Golgi organization protein 1 homolog n=1 Tax=Carassius auratus TaxID=7957 RepID=A0A6P6RKL9_CARAU|nr:transport and Golgi organization protein 1 homolog isoform X8 [Carassius auratus]
MAAPKPCFYYVFTLVLYACFPRSSAERRFSDLKRCADEECSMLLCRGKAAKDFTGPDCRFLSFKKGETIYVYYKLSGQRSDVWAGSIGNHFGYFPKDYLNINHIYTEKELEVPTDETDFVCFATGLDKFESYDIDVLLGSTLLLENEDSTEESKEPAQNPDASQTTTTESVETLESESLDSESTSILGSESAESESQSAHESKAVDSESHLESESVDSDLILKSESVDLESQSVHESESVDLESQSAHESKAVDSESSLLVESKAVDSESASHLESESVDSDLILESESVDLESQSAHESNAVDSESSLLVESKAVDSESSLLVESKAVDSESASHLESESVDSDLILKSQSVDEESASLLESESVNSESQSAHESKAVDSKSASHLESESVDSESILDSKVVDSESVEAPETETLLKSTEEDLHPKTDVSSEPISESKDALTEDTGDIPISQDAEIISEDVETEPTDSDAQEIDYSEVLHNQSDSDFEPLETQPAGLDVVHEEAAETELSDKDIPLQTPEKTLEDEDRSSSKDAFKTDHEGVTQETESLEESLSAANVKEQAGLEGTRAQSDFEELANADEAVDIKIPESSHLPQDAKTPSDASENVSSEPALETHTESEKALNVSEITEEHPKKVDTKKMENFKDLLQKASMNKNENAHTNTSDDPQDALTNNSEKLSETIGEDETLKEELVTESPETAPLFHQTEEQLNKVKNELVNLLKNTLESEQQSPEDEEDVDEDAQELLEDENALLSSKLQLTEDIHELEENQQPEGHQSIESQQSENPTKQEEEKEVVRLPPEEPEYSDNVLRLTILRDHLKDEEMERMQKYFGLKNLFKIEAMFSDLDLEMKSVRELQTDTEEIERTLDQIMEASENAILDATEDILNESERKSQQKEPEAYDFEAAVFDAFQEIAFALRQKYSAASDSAPLLEEELLASETDEKVGSEEEKALDSDIEMIEPPKNPEIHEEQNESEVNLNSELNMNEDLPRTKDVGLEEDGGHFNRNKDAPLGFEDTEEIQKGPHAILEKPVDIGFHFEVDPSSGSLESPSVSDFHDTEASSDSSGSTSDEVWVSVHLVKEYLGVYGEIVITALPEEWRPGPDFHGVPWEPVMATVVVGALTVLMFFWRSVLAIKGRTYQLTEKQLRDKIQQLLNEKSDAANKITELNDMIKEREEQLKNSEKSLSSSQQEVKGLKSCHQKLQSQWEQMSGSVSQLNQKIADTQEENSNLNVKIAKMHQRIEKYQKTLKSYDEERAKVHVLMDEAKLREDAFKAQVLSFEKENGALKEQKKSLLRDAKDWQEKHRKLSEEIRVYHKSQKELEDSLVHKENEIDVLSSCIAELNRLGAGDLGELQKDDAKMSNGEDAEKKMDSMRLRIKQMMDVSRIKATLGVIEDERNRYMESLLAEQKARQELEEQYQKVMHEQMNLNNEKKHLENQFKTLQQRLEITTELYQQKENALQQKLTQEELERHEKESKLSEVDSKALRSEEEVRVLKQKIKDIEEEMQQNERSLKSEVAIQEKKAHENWLKARTSERTLVEERRESANLRQKLVEYREKIANLEESLFKLNSGPPDRHMLPQRRGPRPPSDPHGRFSDLGHPLPSRPDMFPPMTSSPCAHDGPMLSKSQSQGTFLPSPIRDSPVPPPKSYGPPVMPPMMSRPPNGHLPMMPPEPRFRPPPMDSYGPPPPIGPFGPVPPPYGRGPPLGPRDIPPEFFGPRGLPPRPFPPGAMIPPPYGGRGFPGPPPLIPQSSRDGEGSATPANEPPTDASHQHCEP